MALKGTARRRLAAAMLAGVLAAPAQEIASKYLYNIQQLTSGGQNAEAYWSPDGSRIVFQSTRDDLKCDQIFVMNADGTGVRMLSTGKGATTCGYFLPDGNSIVYASTHEGSEQCPPPPDRSKGYVWAVHPTYDIFLASLDGKIQKKLTDAQGYDAEATINWRTGRIVYTSMQSGDLDLWSMKTDGSDKKQLTKSEGYDGGAFYSRDGSKLVWRANHPQTPELMGRYRELLSNHLTSPMKMELFVANADGSEARQITDFGCAAFAPTYTPDGTRIIFSSNKHACDGRGFELYMVNVDGSGLQQITDFGGFTSFPEFSPDGSKLLFTSSWKAAGRYEFNIFVADWR
jgi:TolB protein